MEKIHLYEVDLEDNPLTQISFHKRMMRVWAINAPFVLVIYAMSFVYPAYAIQVASFLGMYTAMVSLYANWATDFDGLSAAQSTLETLKQNKPQTRTIVDAPTNQTKTLAELLEGLKTKS